jgi:hypothetical protein
MSLKGFAMAGAVLAACAVIVLGQPPAALAEDSWNPFKDRDTLRRPPPREPAARTPSEPRLEPFARGEQPWRSENQPDASDGGNPRSQERTAANARGYAPPPEPGEPVFTNDDLSVQRRELAPIAPASPTESNPTPGAVPTETTVAGSSADWPDLTEARFREQAKLLPGVIPSPTLARLVVQVLRTAPEGQGLDLVTGLKRDLLFTRGLFLRPDAELPSPDSRNPLVRTVAARSRIIAGETESGCPEIRGLLEDRATLPKDLFAELLVLGGLCAIETGNASGATLAGQLARDAGYRSEITLDLLETYGTGAGRPIKDGQLSGVDAALLTHEARPVSDKDLDTASPAALAVLATRDGVPVPLRIAAAERAAALHIISPETLARAYETAIGLRVADAVTASTRRARLFLAVRDNRAFLQRARNIRAFLDQARDGGLYLAALASMAPFASEMPKIPEIGWFAETAIEIALAASDFDGARAWADFGERLDAGPRNGFAPWRALIAIAEPGAVDQRSLATLETLAIQRRFDDAELHRLATVLDALNVHVPIGLWNAASATPQPTTGFLPPTGVLRQLADASKARALGPTVMLTSATLGADGPAKANILALGDSVRALVRLGRIADAHALAFEALFESWPRTPSS